MKDSTSTEKLALLALAGGCIIALTWIALKALNIGAVDANASTLIGVIAAGLIAFGKDIVSAIRSYAMSAQLGKVTDQLAASGPAVSEAPPLAADAKQAADEVAAAATDKATELNERTDP